LGKSGLVILSIVSLWSGVSGAATEAPGFVAQQPGQKRHVQASMMCETTSIAPGKTAWLGIHFQIDKDWHVYWNGLNDTGFPIDAKLKGPPGYKVGAVVWPAPIRHVAPGNELDHIYENSVTLLVPVEVPADAKGGAEFSARLSWLVCSKACVPEDAEVKLTVPVGTGSEKSTASAKRFEEARARVPRPWADAGTGAPTLEWKGQSVTIKAPQAAHVAFFPSSDCTPVEDLLNKGLSKGETLTLQLQPEKGVEPLLHGVIEVAYPDKHMPPIAWFEVNQKPQPTAAPTATTPKTRSSN
jgi:thiol:disulfide interchange protein DsbD